LVHGALSHSLAYFPGKLVELFLHFVEQELGSENSTNSGELLVIEWELGAE
jgi:hypothetical protein